MNFLQTSYKGTASTEQMKNLGGNGHEDLLDQSRYVAFDLLTNEVNEHIAKTHHLTEESSGGGAVLESFKKFTGSAHRRDKKHILHFESLMKRLTTCLNEFAQMVADADHQKVALLTWALHLESRLNACIAYNQSEIQSTTLVSEDFCKLKTSVDEERVGLRHALTFYKAVVSQRGEHFGDVYIPWSHDSGKDEYQADANTVLLGHKNSTKKVWKELANILQETNCKIQLCGADLSDCSSSLNVLKGWIAKTRTRKRSVFSATERDSIGAETDEIESVPPFDHSLCQGCSHTHESCSECVMKLAALQLQFDGALQRISLAKQLQELLIETEDAFEKAHHIGE
jgi:hypothetical protein